MTLRDAIDMLAPGLEDVRSPSAWADLGCGEGLFTRALAHLLPASSVVHAMDAAQGALSRVPSGIGAVRIERWHGDFRHAPWPFDRLDGVLMANALHFVRDQPAFLSAAARHLQRHHRFLIVEYDTDLPNPWVPYPTSRRMLQELFAEAGSASFRLLRTRRSRYQRAGMYSALIERDGAAQG